MNDTDSSARARRIALRLAAAAIATAAASVALTGTAFAGTCVGESCTGKSPVDAGCHLDGQVIDQQAIREYTQPATVLGVLTLWGSPSCDANWVTATQGPTGGELEVAVFSRAVGDGRSSTTGTLAISPMVAHRTVVDDSDVSGWAAIHAPDGPVEIGDAIVDGWNG